MADNKMEKSIKEAIGKSLNEFNKKIGMAKLIKDNKNQDRILKGILSQVNDENIEKTEKSNVITLDNSTDGIVELQEIKGDTNVNVSKIEKETPITHVIDDKNGNVISLDGITEGAINIDDIQGNTMVNCNKDTDKELILMPNLDTNGYSNITLTEGIDGGKVDVSLEGNTMVNVCDQEDPIAITKSYTVETGNHIALQGEYDGKCRPNVYGNTLVNLAGNSNLWEVGCSGDKNTDYTITSTDAQGIVINKLTDNIDYLYFRKRIDPSLFKPNTTYTIIFNCSKAYRVGVISGNTAETILPLSPCNDGYNAITLASTDLSTITGKNVIYAYLGVNKSYIGIAKASDFIVLEGDYTNKPIPDYFTGMKSSFEDKLVPENLSSSVSYNGQINKKYTTLCTADASKLKRNTTYTTFIKNDGDEDIQIYSNDTGGNFNFSTFTVSAKSSKVTTIITKDEELDTTKKVWLSLYVTETLPQNISVYLVEGDYTNYDFTDYDSTKGGKYKVDYKVTGKNKFDFNKLVNKIYNQPNLNVVWDRANQQLIISGSTDRKYVIIGEYFHTFEHGKTYTVKNYSSNSDVLIQFVISYVNPTTGNPVYIVSKNAGATFTYDKSWGEMKVYCQIDDILDNISNFTIKFQIEEGTTATTYEPYKKSIKTLYLNSPLLEGDTIEQSGNNIIHNHRYGKVVLDGSNYVPSSEQTLSSVGNYRWRFYISDVKNSTSTTGLGICDKYPIVSPTETWNSIEGITQNNDGNKIVLYLNKYKDGSDASKQALINELSTNPITFIYKKSTPTQEIISTDDNLLLDSYTNGHLDVDTIVPIDKVEFKSSGKNLKYLSPNTEYIIQFESDNNGILYGLNLNNNDSLTNLNIVKGINKFTITTGDTIKANYLWTNGIGFNASKIVVTPKVDNDFGYFKGMKSVGEYEGNKIEILSSKDITPPCKVIYTAYGIEFNFGSKLINENVYVHNISNKSIMIHTSINSKYSNGFKIGKNSKKLIELKQDETIYCASVNYSDGWSNSDVEKARNSFVITKKENEINKKEILMNEPLRGLPNGIRDKYVIIDGKWYIERNCIFYTFNGSENWYLQDKCTNPYLEIQLKKIKPKQSSIICDKLPVRKDATDDMISGERKNICGIQSTNTDKTIRVRVGDLSHTLEGSKIWLANNNISVILELAQPTYEPIDYNPFEVYTDTTHISNNSTISCNMVIKNTGFNCILKPNTTYTVSSNNGLSTITTKDSIGDSVLRFYDKDTSKITKMNNVLVLEGDYVTGNPPIPAFFEGMESAFEQELVTDENDEHYGKYKVTVKAIGKNLLDETKGVINSSFGNSKTICIKVKPNTTYMYSSSKYKGAISVYELSFMVDNNCGAQQVLGFSCKYFSISNEQSFTTSSITNYIYMNYDNTGNVQIEQGDTATEYESYKENNITFYINEPLRGVGDVKDKVYVKEDKVVVQRNCGSVTFDGSNDEEYIIWENNSKKPSQECFVLLNSMKHIPNIAMSSDGHSGLNYTSNNFTRVNVSQVGFVMQYYISMHFGLPKAVLKTDNIAGFRQYLQNNPTTVVYQLATPVYEEVEYSNNRLTLNTYNNSTLFYNSNIPISNTSFKPLWEELIYIKNSTTYYIQFNAVGNGNVVVNLGGTELTATITEGYNKIEITTPNNATNLLTIDGQGIKISKVIVSEALCSGYYKGLQSCFEEHMENGKYVCIIRGISLDGNKVNGIKFYLNEPLRGIGDIKDRLCIKDGKLMVERKFSSVTLDGSEDESIWIDGATAGCINTKLYAIRPNNYPFGKDGGDMIANNFIIRNIYNTDAIDGIWYRGTAFRIRMFNSKLSTQDLAGFKKYLQQNPITIVYQLETTVYEEVTNEYGLPIILEGYENGIVYVDSSVTPTTSIKYTSNNKVPATLSNVDNLNTTTQNDINNNIVTYMMDIDMMLTEMEMDDSASVMSLSDSDDNNQNHDSSHSNILDRMNKEDRIKYQDNTTKMLEKVIKGKSLTKEENINRIDLYLSEGKIRKEQSNYLKELLKGVE